MLFKMMLDNSKEDERPTVRRFLKYLTAGFSVGFFLGVVGYGLMLAAFQTSSIDIPILYALAAIFPMGTLGGLVGVGLFMSAISKDDDDNDRPGGGTKAPVIKAKPASRRPQYKPQGARPTPA